MTPETLAEFALVVRAYTPTLQEAEDRRYAPAQEKPAAEKAAISSGTGALIGSGVGGVAGALLAKYIRNRVRATREVKEKSDLPHILLGASLGAGTGAGLGALASGKFWTPDSDVIGPSGNSLEAEKRRAIIEEATSPPGLLQRLGTYATGSPTAGLAAQYGTFPIIAGFGAGSERAANKILNPPPVAPPAPPMSDGRQTLAAQQAHRAKRIQSIGLIGSGLQAGFSLKNLINQLWPGD